MSDIHVLTGNNDDFHTLVFHFPVPDVDNSVGVNFRTALVNSRAGLFEDPFNAGVFRRTMLILGTPPTIGPGEIDPAEEALLDAGELLEIVSRLLVKSGTTNVELVVRAREKYAQVNSTVQLQLSQRLKYFGQTLSAA